MENFTIKSGFVLRNNENERKHARGWVAALVLMLMLLAGCGAGEASAGQAASGIEPNRFLGQNDDENGASDTTNAIGDPVMVSDGGDAIPPTPEPVAPEVDPIGEAAAVVLAGVGVTGDEPVDAQLKADLASALLPAGSSTDDAKLAEALQARLGPDFAGVNDIDELIKALVEEVPDIGAVESAQDLVHAVEKWATTTVLRVGPAVDVARSITLATSFEDAVALINQPGVIVDLLPGLGLTDLEGIDVSVDEADKLIVVTGEVRDPIAAEAIVRLSWKSGQPEPQIEIRTAGLRLGDLLPDVSLGDLSAVGISDVLLTLDANGIDAAAQLVPSALPSLAGVDLGSVAVPIQMQSVGLGLFGQGGETAPLAIAVPLDPAPYGSWNTERSAELNLTLSASPVVQYQERVVANFGGGDHVFIGTAGGDTAGGGTGELTLIRDGDWAQPFGTPWLTMSDVELVIAGSTDAQSAIVRGNYTLGTKRGVVEFQADSGNQTGVRITGSLDDLGPADLDALAQSLAGTDLLPQGVSVPADVLSLQDVVLSFETGADASSVTVSAITQVLGQTATATFSVVPTTDGQRVPVLVVEPQDVSVAGLFPILADDPVVGDLRLPNSAFVFTARDAQLVGNAIDPEMAGLLGALPGAGDIRLPSGVSLAGAIPGGVAPAIDDVKSLLGMDRAAPVRLAGTIPVAALSGGGGEFVLDLQLPPISPGGSAPWLLSAEVGLRVTSQPSVGIVGAMTLDIGGDVQTFEVEASLGRSQAGVSMALAGRLANPWDTPFDVEWLTLNEAVLQLELDPTGTSMSFSGDIVVGSKDVQGTVGITISPAGVPSNFIFEASSTEGVSLGDFADLYAAMSGQPRPPVESVLPEVEIRDIDLRFAPQGDPGLGVEQGFRVAGELWMANRPGGPLELIVDVDVEVSDQGIDAQGSLTNFALGPVKFDRTAVSLVASAGDQDLSFSGGIDINGSGVNVTIDVTKTEMGFRSTGSFGDSEATLEIAASYDLRSPTWRVRVIMNEQFIRDVDAATMVLIGSEISDINSQIGTAETGLAAAQVGLDAAKITLVGAREAARLCLGLCDGPVKAAEREVARLQSQVDSLRSKLAAGKKALETYDIQLTIVGAEFEAEFGALGANKVAMNLIVDANGLRVPVPVEWDFGKSITSNVDGLLGQLTALG